MARVQQIQVLRGVFANIPILNDGEFYFATDSGQLYVGFGGLNFAVGVPAVATVQVQGNANPTHFIEPNSDGSVNTSLVGTPTVNANSTLVAGTSVSLGTSFGKTAILKTGQLTTAAITANQTVLTYTVTSGKTLYLQYVDMQARLTAVSATASVLGTFIIQIGGVTIYTATYVNPTTSDSGSQAVRLIMPEPVPVSSATVISFLTTPAATTSMLWTANFGGYEK